MKGSVRNGHTYLSRRSFLSNGISFATIRMLPTGFTVLSLSERAESNPAIVTAFQVMSTLSSLANSASSGLDERFRAINIKLDQVMENQIHIMEAISAVQQSLDNLRNDIQGILTVEHYRVLAIDIAEHNLRLVQFSDSVLRNLNFVKNSNIKRAEYQELLIDTRRIVARFKETVNNTDFSHSSVGTKGRNSVLVFAPSLVIISRSVRLLYALEGLYEDIGWHLLDYKQIGETLKSAYEQFNDNQIKQVIDYHFDNYRKYENEYGNLFYKRDGGTRFMEQVKDSLRTINSTEENITETVKFSVVRCYVSEQFRVGTLEHGLFYKNIFELLYDQEEEVVPFEYVENKKLTAIIRVKPQPIETMRRSWYDLEYHGFLADGPRVVSIGDRPCVQIADKEVGQSAKKPYDIDADRKKIVAEFNRDFVPVVERRNQAALELIQVERVSKIAKTMYIYVTNFAHSVSNYLDIDEVLVDSGGVHWKPFDPQTTIE